MKLVGRTNIGKKREVNEDNFFIYCSDNLFCGCVADGMGGYERGEVASKMAVDIIEKSVKAADGKDMDYVELGEAIRHGFIDANYEIYRYAEDNGFLNNMGTTTTLAAVYQNKLITVHVGDCRVYRIGDDISQVTKDHSYVQELLQRGDITEEEARVHPEKNKITRAVGYEPSLKVDVGITDYNGEEILICSDGLSNMLTDVQILDIIKNAENIENAADKLISVANENGGNDNITAVIIENTK